MISSDEKTVVNNAPAKRKRVVTAKPTRNGCKTCRVRRVKCDEARPACAKCTATGRTCDGYSALPPGRTATSRPLLPASRSPSINSDDASSTMRTLSSSHAPSRALTPTAPPSALRFSVSDTERNAFDFFRFRMAGPIEIMSPAKGWVLQALQVGCESQAVFHAIAALGSANLAMASINHPILAGLHKPERYKDALDQYSKTIAALNLQIRDVMVGTAPLQPVLLTCLLLMCFELHAERSSMALRHHAMGQKIVQKALRDTQDGSSPSPRSSDSLQALSHMFDELCVRSTYPDKNQRLVTGPSEEVQHSPTILQVPCTDRLATAWDDLDRLIDMGSELLGKLYWFTEKHVTATYGDSLDQATRHCLASCLSRSVQLPLYDTTLGEIGYLLEDHSRWLNSIRTYDEPDQERSRAFALLQVRQWMASFALKTCRETRETFTDRHEGDFIRVLDLAQIYLEPLNTMPRPVRPRSIFGNGQNDEFTLEDGIISALYLISLKSRTSVTRHRAIEILASAYRREGLGSSTVTAQIAVAIVRVEEDGARGLNPALDTDLSSCEVPERARFVDIVRAAGEDTYRPTCRLVCARYLHEAGGGIEIVEYLSKGPCFPYSKCAGRCLTGFQFEVSKERVQYDISVATAFPVHG